MASALKKFLAAVVVLSLMPAPLAAARKPLGMVIQAENARLGNALAVGGTTVYDSDRVSTGVGGNLRIRVGSAQVYLLTESSASLNDTPSGTSLQLTSGTGGFSTPGEDKILIHALQATIRPAQPVLTHAQVAVVSSNELLVTSFRGAVEVVVGGEIRIVPEATSYRVLWEMDRPDPQGVGADKAKRMRVVMILVGVGIAAGIAGAIVWYNVFRSPSAP